MASFRAISAVTQGVVNLLRSSYNSDILGTELNFAALVAPNFTTNPPMPGISLFLYRVVLNGSYRQPAGQMRPDGQREPTRLPLDLHFILTAWAEEASTQHDIAGWMMRIIEDTPILPGPFLNLTVPDAFRPDETVEIVVGEIDSEDLFLLWERLVPNSYQLSVPYIARNIWVDSELDVADGAPVLQRLFDLAVPNGTDG